MADAKDKSFEQNKQQATPTVPLKTGEISDAEMEKVAGGIEQNLSIGSQSSGAGAGKVIFNPFSITRG
jgi:hypothetical protein